MNYRPGWVEWSKPSLGFHVWRSKFKVLLGVSAKMPSLSSPLSLGKSSGVHFQTEKAQTLANALNGSWGYGRRHSSISKSATKFYFKSTALVPSACCGTMRKGDGSRDYLLPLKELTARRGKTNGGNVEWCKTDPRLNKNQCCRHQAFWAMRKKTREGMRGSLVWLTDIHRWTSLLGTKARRMGEMRKLPVTLSYQTNCSPEPAKTWWEI